MAPTVVKKSYLEMLPEFNGNPQVLSRFLEVAEKLIAKCYNTTNIDDIQNKYLVGLIIGIMEFENN